MAAKKTGPRGRRKGARGGREDAGFSSGSVLYVRTDPELDADIERGLQQERAKNPGVSISKAGYVRSLLHQRLRPQPLVEPVPPPDTGALTEPMPAPSGRRLTE